MSACNLKQTEEARAVSVLGGFAALSRPGNVYANGCASTHDSLCVSHAFRHGPPCAPQMSPCVLEGLPQSNQSFWGAVLPYVCPTAVPLNCSCAALDPNCLNALYWLGLRCAKFLSPSNGFRRTDAWW